MPRLTTFGFEAEFAQNANGVLAELFEMDLAGDRTLHGYHCDCDNCSFHNGYAFRGQTDSSCSGEVISDVFGPGTDYDGSAVSMMYALEQAAVKVDAEPGQNSGFHVHVGVGNLNRTLQAHALWQFIRWEQVLARIAGGRWTDQRERMNRTVRDDCIHTFVDYGGARLTAGGIATWMGSHDAATLHDLQASLLNQHIENDRHSNLNVGQHSHPTWEFRLWNSTRAAWRMELFTGLSVALLDPEVVTLLAGAEPPQRRIKPSSGIEDVALACDLAGHTRTAELLQRQSEYLDDRAVNAPAILTAL